MDANSLPDDPRNWPTDPFSLLGVPRSVSEADLKRAYTRLIKKYKPEHAPDEFRRIREAYEAAIEMSRWFRDAPPVRDTFRDMPFTPVSPIATPLPPQEASDEVRRETQIDPPVRPVSFDPVEEAWADAVAGKWTEAYAALVSLAESHAHRADLPLRLYWLLALRPTLDDSRTRHDWLAETLTRAELSGPAVDLYRRELASDPSVALYGLYLKLLELPGVNGRRLLEFATIRFSAAGAESRWALLEIDVAALAHRVPDFDETEWLRYLIEVASRASGDKPPLFVRCRELLAGLRHLELSHGWAFDAFDHREVMLTSLRQAHIPEPIRRALSVSFAGADDEKALKAAVAWAASNPAAAMLACDAAMYTHNDRALLTAFGRLLAERQERLEPTQSYLDNSPQRAVYPPELIRQFVRLHLTRGAVRDGVHARKSILLFLLAERIDPEELVSACVVDPNMDTRMLVEELRDDESLRLVYRTASAMM